MKRSTFVRSCIPRIALGAGLAFAPPLLLPGGEAAAQATATIVVTLVDDTTLEPLEGAKIQLDGVERTAVTDARGRAFLSDVRLADITLRAEHTGYGSVVEVVEVSAAEVLFLQIRLLRIDAILSGILVVARARSDEQGSSQEHVPGGVDAGATAADLLARGVPGLVVNWGSGLMGAGASVDIRGRTSINASTIPAIYLDGVRIDARTGDLPGTAGTQGLHVLQTIPASEVKEIRVLRGPSAAARYEDSVNGVILIELRKGTSGNR
jgi:hypothetical protein